MLRELKVYECPECGELVRDGDYCCDPDIFDAWQCEECGEIYEEKPTECDGCGTKFE